MSQIATITDFEARHGEVSDADETVIENLLDDAAALILLQAGSGVSWAITTEGEGEDAVTTNSTPRAVVALCVAAAFRAWRNPAGVSSESLGASSVTYSAASDGVWLTERDLQTIRSAAGNSGFRAATLSSPYSGESSNEPELPL